MAEIETVKIPKPKRSITIKLIGIVLLAVCFSAVFSSVFLVMRETRNYAEQRDRELHATARIFASTIAEGTAERDRTAVLRTLRAIGKIPGLDSVRVIDLNGQTIAELGSGVKLASRSETGGWFARLGQLFGTPMMVQTPIIKSGKSVGRLILYSGVDGLRDRIIAQIRDNMLAALAAATISMLIAYWLQKKITRPLRELTSAMTGLTENREFVETVKRTSNDEIGTLVDVFNTMTSQIRVRDFGLAQQQEHLEHEVAVRTAQLQHMSEGKGIAPEAGSGFVVNRIPKKPIVDEPVPNGDNDETVPALTVSPSIPSPTNDEPENPSENTGLFARAPIADAIAIPISNLSALNVVLTGNNPSNLSSTADALARLQVSVHIANNVEEAVDLIDEDGNLILIDCGFNNPEGYEMARRYRAYEHQQGRTAAPLVALVVDQEEVKDNLWRDAGMDGYVIKPFTGATLAKALAKWIPNSAAAAPIAPDVARGQPIANPSTTKDSSRFQDLPILDPLWVRRFEKAGSGDEATKMIEQAIALFTANADASHDQLQAALVAQDRDTIAQIAGSMADMAGQIGAARLSRLCQTISEKAASIPVGSISKLSAICTQELTAAKQHLGQIALPMGQEESAA